MDPSYQLPSFLCNSDLLVDTNFFIDSFNNPENFALFISTLKQNGVEIVSTHFVKYEFLRSKTIDVVKRKENFFNKLTGTVLPFDMDTEKQMVDLIEEYKQYMEGVSIVDLVLGCLLRRYKSRLYLLTRDHGDFPTTIFDRKRIFNINGIRDIKTYAVYSYGTSSEESREEVGFE
ncbi:MAG: type II toxin-antitoxin system VapC family toxin [Patescibacteria group bacterium]